MLLNTSRKVFPKPSFNPNKQYFYELKKRIPRNSRRERKCPQKKKRVENIVAENNTIVNFSFSLWSSESEPERVRKVKNARMKTILICENGVESACRGVEQDNERRTQQHSNSFFSYVQIQVRATKKIVEMFFAHIRLHIAGTATVASYHPLRISTGEGEISSSTNE